MTCRPVNCSTIVGSIIGYMFVEGIVNSRIIKPLTGFGLIECKFKKEKYFSRIDEVRKSKLFDKFVVVEWRGIVVPETRQILYVDSRVNQYD